MSLQETGNGNGIGKSTRPSWPEVWMAMAETISRRSTCSRLQVGTLLVTEDLHGLVGIGYNGNAKGLPNCCDSNAVGQCGCIHSEMNAIANRRGDYRGPIVALVTHVPCVMCCKMLINADVKKVYYKNTYRDTTSLSIFEKLEIPTVHLESKSEGPVDQVGPRDNLNVDSLHGVMSLHEFQS